MEERKPEALGLRRASPLSPGAERRLRNCIRKNADCWVKESQEPAWGLVLGTTDGHR